MPEIRGPRVEAPPRGAPDYGWWLTWEVEDMGGAAWRWEQRKMRFWEVWLYRLFRRVPNTGTKGDS